MIMNSELIKVKANQKLNLGKQENGRLLNFKEGEEKVVEMNSLIKRFIDSRALTLLEGSEEDAEELDELEKFTELNWIGSELAQILKMKYGTYEEFKKKATKKSLEELPGLGKQRAEEVYNQLRGTNKYERGN